MARTKKTKLIEQGKDLPHQYNTLSTEVLYELAKLCKVASPAWNLVHSVINSRIDQQPGELYDQDDSGCTDADRIAELEAQVEKLTEVVRTLSLLKVFKMRKKGEEFGHDYELLRDFVENQD